MESNSALIYQRMGAIMQACNAIGKDRKNEQQNYKFRGIDDVMNELHEYFANAGVIVIPKILKREREERINKSGTPLFYSFVEIEYTFICAEDGSSITATGLGEGMDSGDKSTNKAQSSALKYVLLQTFLIPTEDKKDVENEDHQLKGKNQTKPQNNNAPAANPAPVALPAKRKISQAGLDKLILRIGEPGIVSKTKDAYDLTEDQSHQLNEAYKAHKQKFAASAPVAPPADDNQVPETVDSLAFTIGLCTTESQIDIIFNKFTHFHSNKDFTDMINDQRMSIQNKNK